jgi:hypothetical protein
MQQSEVVFWLVIAAAAVGLVALDAKAKMTWLFVALGIGALVVALYAGVDLRALARR